MVEVNKAKYLGDYVINLSFNNGRSGNVNLEESLFNDKRAAFAVLRDKSEFSKFKVEHSTLVWGDEFELAAEYLFFLAFKDDPELQDQFKAWGYVA
ncbi:hypothetical protein BIU88_10115 [Chlorobaculum limnaeum]|uniref:DUF2442 domain-containing protein n=1 Tax=Chlorobaculum limnaeum TaxID=274537 RepID=A0A1D8D3T9_CHLLM|nr:DUF2442 domain-containing protein [Chlorobaculum limnaeum]AOS84455.1 hypothetical protein BIU88_10115 [Chlorobaculum limnaeum]